MALVRGRMIPLPRSQLVHASAPCTLILVILSVITEKRTVA